MLLTKEYVRVCYGLYSRIPHTTLDIMPLVKAFLHACRNSRIVLRVEAGSSIYNTIIEFRSPKGEFSYCSKVIEALIAAELGDEVSYSRVSCSENFRVH